MPRAAERARPAGATVFAALFTFVAALDAVQVLSRLVGPASQPPRLVGLHALAGIVAAGTAVGAWRGTRWAPLAAILWGAVMIALLASVAPRVPDEARGGIWAAAWVMATFAAVTAWYLARHVRPITAAAPRPSR